jgi:nicotinamidase-related amidase
MFEKPALIIVDMQQGMKWPSLPERNNPDAESNIATLLGHWRSKSAPVVHVRHLSRTPTSPFWPGQSGVEFQPEFLPLETEHVVKKSVPDAFVHSGFEQWLHRSGIKSVVVVGVSTNISVQCTARSAGNLGFQTYVASNATFAFAKHDIDGALRSAAEVHSMALSNLHGEYATVELTNALLRLV